mgnify:CR=1 FL=1
MTNMTPATTAACDPRPFLRHMALANLWCQYNGQRGTERQVLRVMRQLTAADLERMLTERRVDLSRV